MKNRAFLIGSRWEEWRGVWEGSRCLVSRDGAWHLENNGAARASWPDLRSALVEVWPARQVRDASPWAVGWIGYEEAARFAGGLPCREEADSAPPGFLILEPGRGIEGDQTGEPAFLEQGATANWSLAGSCFRQGVEFIRQRIEAGDVYQVNLSRRLTVEGWMGSLNLLVSAASRGGTPDYLAQVEYDGGELVCASMEMLLHRRGDKLETRPIKGTRPRGAVAEDDRKLADALENDPKERAELAMIVDLERNDLGRISETGSIHVSDPGSVQSFPAVHHRVATVTGRLREGIEWWDALAAMVPGGSVTGCPKLAAMSVIKELETVPRGPFCGAFGVVAGNGDLELALPIRTAWKVGSLLEFAAGCGIVWESNADSEEKESRLKVARWLDIVEEQLRAMA